MKFHPGMLKQLRAYLLESEVEPGIPLGVLLDANRSLAAMKAGVFGTRRRTERIWIKLVIV